MGAIIGGTLLALALPVVIACTGAAYILYFKYLIGNI